VYDVLLMISPNLCSDAFHFNLMVFDLKKKIIQFFDPTINDIMTPLMKQRNRIFFFNIFSIFLTFFHTHINMPGHKYFLHLLENNFFCNSPVIPDGVKRALIIYGPDISFLKGIMRRSLNKVLLWNQWK